MTKEEVAQVLEEIGELLDIKGENPFKVRAYHNAARALAGADRDIGDLVATGDLRTIKGIGEGIAEKIAELVKTGHLKYYEELKSTLPSGITNLLAIPGLGPKKVKKICDALGISTVGELEYACNENRLVDLEGFGVRSQEKILEGIAYIKKSQGQFHIDFALQNAGVLLEKIKGFKGVARAEIAGSLRRRKEVVKDIDIVAATARPGPLMEFFASLPVVDSVIAKGETKTSIRLKSGMNADLRAVSEEEFPFALMYLTGSKDHNTTMRGIAKKAGYKLNEYGLFKGERKTACRREEDIFAKLGMAYIPPEMREDAGEIAAAEEGKMPDLVEEKDIRGLFHVHTTASDGTATLEQMALAAKKIGCAYLGIADHSRSARYAGGLDAADVRKQHKEIDALNGKLSGLILLKGIESDILPDGSLDYPDAILAAFDFVIASIHSKFNMTEAEATKRLVKAMKNKHVTMLGHPTGRLLLSREGYPVDMRQVIDAAADLGVAIEINAHPFRLDLDWRLVHHAKEKGAKVAINPDAHSVEGLKDVSYGVGIARKGWLEVKDVVNAWPLEKVRRFLASRRG